MNVVKRDFGERNVDAVLQLPHEALLPKNGAIVKIEDFHIVRQAWLLVVPESNFWEPHLRLEDYEICGIVVGL